MKSRRFSLRRFFAGAGLAAGLVAGAANAAGLVLNIEDTGFDPIPAGGTIEYQVRIDNGGNARTEADKIEFTIPEGATYTGTSGGLTGCTPAPNVEGVGTVSCHIPELAPRASVVGVVNIVPSVAGLIDLEGTLRDAGGTDNEGTTVTEGADLELGFTAPSDIRAGEILSFDAVITNHGPYPANVTTFTTTLPEALLSDDLTLPAGCAIAGSEVTCAVAGPIAVGNTITLPFSTQVVTSDASTVTVPGSVSGTAPADPNFGNNSSSFSIDVDPGTDLQLQKGRSPSGLLYVGQDVTFTLTPAFVGIVPGGAEITDTLPANYEFVSVNATGTGWTCDNAGNQVTCSYSGDGTDAASFRAPIQIVATPITETAAGSPVTNTAEIAAPAGAPASADVRTDNNTASDGGADIVTPATDLVAHKTAPTHELVTVGNSYPWQIWTSNTGNIGFTGTLILTDHLPDGLELTAIDAPAGWSCDAPPVTGPAEVVTCTSDNYTESALGVGAATPPITLTTKVLAEGKIENVMTVDYSGANYEDRDLSNNTIVRDVTSGEGTEVEIADLRLEKTVADSGPHFSGEPVTFKITVFNDGEGDAEDVRVLDRLEDLYFADNTTTAVTLDSVPGDVECSVTRGAGFYSDLSCTVANLPADESRSITFTALAGGNAGAKTNSAQTYSTQTPDPDFSNNSASVTYDVSARTDVVVEKTASHPNMAEVRAGQPLIYVLHASVPDTGLSDADGVTVTDDLPAGLRVVSTTPSRGSCTPVTGIVNGLTTAGSKLVCDLGTIISGNVQTVEVEVVPSTAIASTTIINDVTVSTSTVEIDEGNNTAEISHQITRPSLDLVTNKTDLPDPVQLGETTTYTVTVENAGPSEAFDLEITDILPEDGLRYESVTPISDGLTCVENGAVPGNVGGKLLCSLANLGVDEIAKFEVEMTAIKRGVWENRAEARSAEFDDEPLKTNNDVDETTTVYERSDLLVTKVASQNPVDLNEPFNWTITVQNGTGTGIGVAENVVLKDTLPENMEVLGSVSTTSPSDTGASCDAPVGGRNLICIIDDMKAGAEVSVTLPVRVTSASENLETVSNSATVTTDSFDDENITGEGTVEVKTTSVSGTIWRDFNENNERDDPRDSGIADIMVELTGKDEWGNDVVLQTITTDSDGTYSFGLLPPGDYRVSYAPPADDSYLPGSALSGNGGGNADGKTAISDITATTAQPAIDNDFTLIPQAQVALAKEVSEPAFQSDGSYELTYTFRIANQSQEPISNFTLIDYLDTSFGTYVSGTPDHGEFQVVSVNEGTLSTGAATELVLSSPASLAAGATRAVAMVLQVNPALPRTAATLTHTNNANVEGTGDWSDKTPSDGSNNGDTPQHGEKSDTIAEVTFAPEITLEKTATAVLVGDSAAPGDRINYTFKVTNTGNTPLQGVTIDDSLSDLVWDMDGPITRLDPRASDDTTFTAHYILTQIDIEAGGVENIAKASGRWAVDGVTDPIVTHEDSAAIETLAEPSLEVVKKDISEPLKDPSEIGEIIRYEFTVTNTGNVELRDLELKDILPGIEPDPAGSFNIGTLARAGEAGNSVTFHANYSVTQADINSGEVVNKATVSGHYGTDNTKLDPEPESNEVRTPLHQQPDMLVTKVLDGEAPEEPRARDPISWTITIDNTGNTTLANIVIDEPLTGASVGAALPSVVAPGHSASATVTYKLTQAEIDAGEIFNQVVVSGEVPGSGTSFPDTPSNDPNNPEEERTRTELPAAPSIALLKELVTDVSEPLMPGDEIKFAFTIRNTGNVTLDNLVLTDHLDGVVLDPASLAGTSLAPDAETMVNGTYTITTADIESGEVENTATVTGHDPHDAEVTDHSGTGFDNDESTKVTLLRNPDISLIKRISNAPDAPVTEGDVVEYAFEIRNTGNVELRDITLTDLVGDVQLSGSRPTPLPVRGVDATSFSGQYTLTQDDIDAGVFANSAEVEAVGTGESGSDEPVSDISGTDVDNDDPTELPINPDPSLTIVKEADDSQVDSPAEQGDEISYSFTITNTGNVTLSNVTVTDPLLGGDLLDDVIPTLTPGEEQVVEAVYSVILADIDTGKVVNQASVTGTFEDPVTGDETKPRADSEEVEVPLDQGAGIAVVKTADSAITDPAEPGQEIAYTFTIINTGNVTLKDVVLEDPLEGLSTNRFEIGDMAPGAEETRQATYKITQDDIDAGEVLNQAIGTGIFDDTIISDPSGPDPESDEKTRVEVPQAPGLTLEKSADASEVSDPAVVGEKIEYHFTVTNTGNVTLHRVEVSDALEGLEPGSYSIGEMAPDATVEVGPAIYEITQEDITAGKVENRALASGEWGPPDEPKEIESSSTNEEGVDGPTVTPISGVPAIALVKKLAPDIDAESLALGDEISWVFAVHNTGNVPLENITIEERKIDATVSGGPINLDPGEIDSETFTASYTITQDDLDAGQIENQARVMGVFDDGPGSRQEVDDLSGTTVDDDDPTVTDLGQRPAIDLVKTADISELGSPPQARDIIRYTFTITNKGEVTLNDVTITDPMPGLKLSGTPIPSLAPGAVNDTAFTATYELTQADIDSGEPLENQATVTGKYKDPSGTSQDVTDLSGTEIGTDTPTTVDLDREPGLELEKTADDSAITDPAEPGQEIVYTFTVTNTGNVTLEDVEIIDPLPGLVLFGGPIASLAPGKSSDAITGTYPLIAEDIIATERENTARAEGIWHPSGGGPETVPSNDSTVTVGLGYPEIDFDITIGELRDLNGDGRMGPGDEVVFHFEVHNTGTVPLHDVNVDGDTLSVPLPGLSCVPITLAVGESAFLTCTGAGHIITGEDAERGKITQQGDATGTSDIGVVVRASSEAATLTDIGAGGVSLEKLAAFETAMIGDLVPYTISITNAREGVPVTTRIVDTLPVGFTYRSESAQLDDEKVELAENGRKLTLEPVTVDPGQTRVLKLEARVGGSVRPGAHDNRVRLISPLTGREIAPEAKATVRVLADPVLQCATVIGRVFDDVDQNGHMSKSAEERGLPNVRLIAPNGLAILTDEHGRYNVPCAALPRAIGSNFMLKLDERTLPAGYRMTTENPRVVRLTPGMMTRLDFGATLARLVRVDLAANSFTDGHMGPALEAGLNQLVSEISGQVAMLRITYLQAPGESKADARQHIRLVERHLRDLWSREGQYKLNIETLIQRGGDAK